jgi:hypothetical protein
LKISLRIDCIFLVDLKFVCSLPFSHLDVQSSFEFVSTGPLSGLNIHDNQPIWHILCWMSLIVFESFLTFSIFGLAAHGY